jgi:hypothetical protein
LLTSTCQHGWGILESAQTIPPSQITHDWNFAKALLIASTKVPNVYMMVVNREKRKKTSKEGRQNRESKREEEGESKQGRRERK